MNIDQPESDFASADQGSCQASALFNAGRAATAAAGYDFNDYDHESFMLPESQQNMRCDFAGLGQQPGKITWNVCKAESMDDSLPRTATLTLPCIPMKRH